MKISNKIPSFITVLLVVVIVAGSCDDSLNPDNQDDVLFELNYGTLVVDFELPDIKYARKGIRRVDLAVCRTLDELHGGKFFYRTNVSDARQYYQIYLPEGKFYYQAVITCTCGSDTCVRAGFASGYGGMKYAFHEVVIEKGKKTISKPAFQ